MSLASKETKIKATNRCEIKLIGFTTFKNKTNIYYIVNNSMR